MNINWYPGHMKKTKESIIKNLSMVDVVFEIIDARIPISSRNPDIDKIIKDKPRVILINKSDLSDHRINKQWEKYFNKQDNTKAVLIDSKQKKGFKGVMSATEEVTKEKMNILRERGIENRAIRAMIIGIPNVGKSTFINSIAKRKSAKVGNKPGITKTTQWVKLSGNLDLLDTPGILWPKFEDKEVGENLAFTGAIKDEILDIETLAFKLIERLNTIDKSYLINRYGVNNKNTNTLDVMEEIAKKRGCVLRGNEFDYTKVSNLILDEFRKGVIGNITLETPEEL